MVKVKRLLNSKERDILRVLHKQGGSMTPNEIAKETGFSYVTIRKYLKRLIEDEVIEEV